MANTEPDQEETNSPFPWSLDAPPGGMAVFPANSPQFALVMTRTSTPFSDADADSFAIRRSCFHIFITLFLLAWGGGVGYATLWGGRLEGTLDGFRQGNYINGLGDIVFVLAVPVVLFLAAFTIFGRVWYVFLPDRLIVYTRFLVAGYARTYLKNAIATAQRLRNGGNIQTWNVTMRLANEDTVELMRFGNAERTGWLAASINFWLGGQRQTAEAVTGVSAEMRYEQSHPGVIVDPGLFTVEEPHQPIYDAKKLLLHPPDLLFLYEGAAKRSLEESLVAAGQPPFEPDAVAIGSKGHPIMLLPGGFLVLWLCGWYSSVFKGVATILQGNLKGNLNLLFFIPLYAVIGLLPMRVFGSILLRRFTLVLESQRIRLRVRILSFRRDHIVPLEIFEGTVRGERVLGGIIKTLSLRRSDGEPIVILEDGEDSNQMRWLERVLDPLVRKRG